MERTPLTTPKSGVKRTTDKTDLENLNDSKRLNSSGNSSFAQHYVESQLKDAQIKLITLEQTVKNLEIENKTQKIEFQNEKDKLAGELRYVQEQKYDMEQNIKKCRTNEKVLTSEMEHLRQRLDKFENNSLPDKDKLISALNVQISELKIENSNLKLNDEKTVMDLNADLKDKQLNIEQLNNEIANLNESLKKMRQLQADFDAVKSENTNFENKIKDLEMQISRSNDTVSVETLTRETEKVADLERNNRKLQFENNYLLSVQEKAHVYKEELDSLKKKCERLEQSIVQANLENTDLKQKLKEQEIKSQSKQLTETPSKYKDVISELEGRIRESDVKTMSLNKRIHQLEDTLNDKTNQINELNKRIARLNSERNGYKNIVEMYDSDRKLDPSDLSEKRIIELENILNEYKQLYGENVSEVRMGNDQIYKMNAAAKVNAEVQVNLSSEIYNNYENQIRELTELNTKLRENNSTLESRLERESERGEGLHLECNPLQQAIISSEAQKLVDENMELKEVE